MTTEFKVFVLSSEKRSTYDIDQAKFDLLRDANARLIFGLAFEQRFDIALENFAELESCLLNFALRDAVFSGATFSQLHGSRHTANRRLTNLMSSTRLYLDQTAHALSSTFGANGTETKEFQRLRSHEYDSSFGYRVLEALRNYSQHCGLPAHSITFSSAHDDVEDASTKTKHLVAVSLSVPALAEHRDFKAETLQELRKNCDSKGQIQLMPLVREYFGCLGRIHDAARALVAGSLAEADDLMCSHIDRAEADVGTRDVIVHASKLSDGHALDDVWIGEGLTEQRNEYALKSRFAKHISKQYVASC